MGIDKRKLRVEYEQNQDEDKFLDALADLIVNWGIKNGAFESVLQGDYQN